MLKEGATVSKHIADEGNKKAVVTTVKSESDEVVIVDLCTREPSTVQNHLDVELPIWGPWGASRSGDGDHGVCSDGDCYECASLVLLVDALLGMACLVQYSLTLSCSDLVWTFVMCLLNFPVQVKLTAVEMEDSVPGCIDKSQLDSLMCILTLSLQLTEQSA